MFCEAFSDQEIKTLWHYSNRDNHQLEIISQLTCKTEHKVAEFLDIKLKKPKKRKLIRYSYDVEVLQADCLTDMPIADIAKKHNVPRYVVSRRKAELKSKGIDVPNNRFKYSKHVIDKALELRRQGFTYSKIKQITGVKASILSKYINKAPHVTGNNVESNEVINQG